MPVKRLWVKVNKCPVKMDPTMICIYNARHVLLFLFAQTY